MIGSGAETARRRRRAWACLRLALSSLGPAAAAQAALLGLRAVAGGG